MSARDINWSEGLFVQPHHFQQAFLNLEERLAHFPTDYVPHFHGVSQLSISESDCENYNFHIEEISCRFPDGIRITYPGNAVIESRQFKERLDSNQGRIEVFLGLPKLNTVEPNVLRYDSRPLGGVKYRYISKVEEIGDLVTGKNTQELEVKLFNPKILFSGESTFGYDVVKIAEVERSGQFNSVPELDKEYVPPCFSVKASAYLQHIMREVGNRLIAKNRTLREYWKSKDTATLMKARDALKVQSLAVSTNSFLQLSSGAVVHPFVLYSKIAEIIGMLSIYCEDDRFVEVPIYDHDNLAKCYKSAHANMIKLLSLLEELSYEARVFEISGESLNVEFDARWFDDKYEHYICFEAKQEEPEVLRHLGGLKIAPENIIPILNQRRMRGIDLEGPVRHLSHIPTSPYHHYFKIPVGHALFRKLQDHPVLSIWGTTQFAELVTLYILEKK